MIETDIADSIRMAATQGDNQRLHSLAIQFPQQFTSACTEGLLETAHTAKQPDTVLYLILKHHCLINPATLPADDIELYGERRAQLHRTLEVLADAARGNTYNDLHEETRGCGCYDVSNLAYRAGEGKMRDDALRPLLLQSAANGDLQNFAAFVHEEEAKGDFYLGRHSGSMLRALEIHSGAIAAYALAAKPIVAGFVEQHLIAMQPTTTEIQSP